MGDILKDKNGRRIGEIKDQGSNWQVAVNANGNKLGEYNCRTNETCDKYGRRIGTGNLLAGLIYNER
jgi:hypothetical protein